MIFSDPSCRTSTETDRNACGVNPLREAELSEAGWERRATADEPRLSDAAETYRALGFEVHLELFDPSAKGEGGCTSCFEHPDAAKLFKTIYTRKTKAGLDGDLS